MFKVIKGFKTWKGSLTCPFLRGCRSYGLIAAEIQNPQLEEEEGAHWAVYLSTDTSIQLLTKAQGPWFRSKEPFTPRTPVRRTGCTSPLPAFTQPCVAVKEECLLKTTAPYGVANLPPIFFLSGVHGFGFGQPQVTQKKNLTQHF